MPANAIADPKARGLAAQRLGLGAAAHMIETPMQAGRQSGERGEENVIALLGHRPANGQDHHRIARVAAVAARGCVRGWRKAAEIETVISEFEFPFGGQGSQGGEGRAVAGHGPLAASQLFALFPVGDGPDVAGMGGYAPWAAAQPGGVAGD